MDNDERLFQMRQLRAEGMTCQEIGKHFGISQQRVGQILSDRPKHTPRLKEPKHQPVPKISIHEVLKIAEKVKEETGRYPSYGKVVQGIENGKIDPWRYIRRKRRVI